MFRLFRDLEKYDIHIFRRCEFMTDVTTAKAVANFFLSRAREEGMEITHLKLQKLVYYAYAWWAGNFDSYLFGDEIEAWPHGPVVRELYVEFHDAGRLPIKRLAQDYDYISHEGSIPKVSEEAAENLEGIWQGYKKLSGIQLSNMTHMEGEPWSEVGKAQDLSLKPRIPPELIREIYTKKVASISEPEPTAAA
jgi:uncharacterized phage-associated protein